MQIQLYKHSGDNEGKEISFLDVLEMIKNDSTLKKQIESLRKLKYKSKSYDYFKKSLPCVTFSGTFFQRNSTKCNVYSNLMSLDIDGLETPEIFAETFENVINDPYTLLAFKSPSGIGIKIVIQLGSSSKELHKHSFKCLEKYYFDNYNYKVDKLCKDISRLCYLVHDPNLYYNENALRYNVPPPPPKQKKEPFNIQCTGNENDAFVYAVKIVEKSLQYVEGQRNKYVYDLAAQLNRYGIPKDTCTNFIFNKYHVDDTLLQEFEKTIASAYTHQASQHGKHKILTTKKQEQSPATLTIQGAKKTEKQNIAKTSLSNKDELIFWDKYADGYYDAEETKQRFKYVISYVKLENFLLHHGYYNYKISEQNKILVHYKDNIIKQVQEREITEFIFDWVRQRLKNNPFDGNHYHAIYEMIFKGCKTYFGVDKYALLPFINVTLNKSTPTTEYLYFKNKFLKITASEVTQHEYKELDKAIWYDDINQHEINYIKDVVTLDEIGGFNTLCEYATFISCCAYNFKVYDEKLPDYDKEKIEKIEVIQEKINSFCTSIGYLLHAFKDPSNAKMVLCIDNKMGDKTDQNGGTGKSIFGDALTHVKACATIDGKSYNDQDPFKFSDILPKHKVYFFNDVKTNFKLESLFNVCTNTFKVNYKHAQPINIPFVDSGKVLLSSNSVPGGVGSSFIRRLQIIEFSDYFTPDYTPNDEFGHNLFNDWDYEQWNLFYSFMVYCLQLYLNKKLVKYPGGNYEYRRLNNECPHEFIDWLNGKIEDSNIDNVSRNTRHPKKKYFDEYKKIHEELFNNKLSMNTFTRYLKAAEKNQEQPYLLNPHKPNKMDKSNGKEFITLFDKDLYEKFQKEIPTMCKNGTIWNQNTWEKLVTQETLFIDSSNDE